MKLILTVKNNRNGSTWIEDYDSDNQTEPRYFASRRKKTMRVETIAEAHAWGEALIKWFNSTCTLGEATRLPLKVELVPNA